MENDVFPSSKPLKPIHKNKTEIPSPEAQRQAININVRTLENKWSKISEAYKQLRLPDLVDEFDVTIDS